MCSTGLTSQPPCSVRCAIVLWCLRRGVCNRGVVFFVVALVRAQVVDPRSFAPTPSVHSGHLCACVMLCCHVVCALIGSLLAIQPGQLRTLLNGPDARLVLVRVSLWRGVVWRGVAYSSLV